MKTDRRSIAIRQFVVVGLALFPMLFLAAHCTGCLTDEIHKDVAGGLYAAQQNACIDKYADRASIDACRARVKAAWAVDAGKEAGQ